MLNLKALRLTHGFTQASLSEAAGVPKRTIEDAEARKDCRISTAYRLAKAMSVSLDDLWIEDPEQ